MAGTKLDLYNFLNSLRPAIIAHMNFASKFNNKKITKYGKF